MDGIVSSRTRQDKFIFNHDIYSDRYTFSVEIVPICYGDLIFLPPKIAFSLGNISPIIICRLLKELLCLIFPLRYCILNVDQYWNALFTPSLTRSQLVEYSVLDIVERYSVVTIGGTEYGLANIEISHVKDFGKNDTTFKI